MFSGSVRVSRTHSCDSGGMHQRKVLKNKANRTGKAAQCKAVVAKPEDLSLKTHRVEDRAASGRLSFRHAVIYASSHVHIQTQNKSM